MWGFYATRLLIGFWVGVTRWPPSWYVRGPLCGFLALFPLTIISLAMPGCGGCWRRGTANSASAKKASGKKDDKKEKAKEKTTDDEISELEKKRTKKAEKPK